MKLTRRDFVPLAAAAALSGYAGWNFDRERKRLRIGASPVFIAKADSYRQELADIIVEGARACGLQVKGRRVLLKPNLVEVDRATATNTDVAVVAAALEAFEKLGAADVTIGEGPGHRRDTMELASLAGYRGGIPGFDKRFVDLNLDDVSAVAGFPELGTLYLPHTALRSDLIVSLAKMKTHHWAGATLAMKNLFGVVPGAVYGWPKNVLHQAGIAQSIVDLNAYFCRGFAIVDGIVGMEGNGPIQGTPKKAGVLVMGADAVAVDATCCRIMGIDPAKIEYLQLGADLGHLGEASIEQRGETVRSVRADFALIEELRHLRLSPVS